MPIHIRPKKDNLTPTIRKVQKIKKVKSKEEKYIENSVFKKAVVTILGTVGGSCDKEDLSKGKYNTNTESAFYESKIEGINSGSFVNTLPLLLDTFSKDYDIIALHTSCAKDIQQEVLKSDGRDGFVFESDWLIEDDLEFDSVFYKIDALIGEYDRVIIDVSHGFRHLPILMIINAVMYNIEAIDKIEKIIFARQIEAFTYYELIDLKRYLDLANISYALTTFDRNYTVANNVKVADKEFNSFLSELSDFSKHILANSLDELLTDTNKKISIVTRLINGIEILEREDGKIFKSLERLLEKTKNHLLQIRSYGKAIHYKKHFYLSENMFSKGYLLNAITLLSEAIGMYCSLALMHISPKIAEKITLFEERAIAEKNNQKTPFKLYELYNQSKTLFKIDPQKYRGSYLKVDIQTKNEKNKAKLIEWNSDASKLTDAIVKKVINLQNEHIRQLAWRIDNIRNNLAHANSSQRLKEVEEEISVCLLDFRKYCIEQNVLSVSLKL